MLEILKSILPSALFEDEDVEQFFQDKPLYSCEYCHVHLLNLRIKSNICTWLL